MSNANGSLRDNNVGTGLRRFGVWLLAFALVFVAGIAGYFSPALGGVIGAVMAGRGAYGVVRPGPVVGTWEAMLYLAMGLAVMGFFLAGVRA